MSHDAAAGLRTCFPRLKACLAALLVLVSSGAPASALQFETHVLAGNDAVIIGEGPIIAGDTGRLEHALARVPPTAPLLGLVLDSPGGSVVEGEALAHLIRAQRLAVLIPSNAKCVSACFLMLAASVHRIAAADALIGVHSANENGEETRTSLAVTTIMARDADQYGIPPVILGKMVRTRPEGVDWLTPADLAAMDVTLFEGDPLAALRQKPGVTAPPNAPPVMAAPAVTAPPAFVAPVAPPIPVPLNRMQIGQQERQSWNAWFASLHGAYQAGAAFAVSQGPALRPASCYGPNNENRGDFSLGCEIARRRLLPLRDMMLHDADFLTGWNSEAPVASPSLGTVEAHYQGAFFCGHQVGRLTVSVYAPRGVARQQALVQFGPQPTSPEIPVGAFLAEGLFDTAGGTVQLTPLRWVRQPVGYPWLGLSGQSDDGGRTFSGRVTDRTACSVFTLRHVGADSTAAR